MLDKLIDATSQYYNLPSELVCGNLAKAISDYYSEIFQKVIICTIDNGEIEACICDTLADRPIKLNVTQADITAIIKRYRILLNDSESNMRLFQYARYRRSAIKGTVSESETVQIEGLEGVIGICSTRDMGERLPKGTITYFYIKSVEVNIEGSLIRCVFHLSRTAKALPVKLLEASIKNPDVKLRCYKRVVGKISFIQSSEYIRRRHIEKVSEQLCERIIMRKFSI